MRSAYTFLELIGVGNLVLKSLPSYSWGLTK